MASVKSVCGLKSQYWATFLSEITDFIPQYLELATLSGTSVLIVWEIYNTLDLSSDINSLIKSTYIYETLA